MTRLYKNSKGELKPAAWLDNEAVLYHYHNFAHLKRPEVLRRIHADLLPVFECRVGIANFWGFHPPLTRHQMTLKKRGVR